MLNSYTLWIALLYNLIGACRRPLATALRGKPYDAFLGGVAVSYPGCKREFARYNAPPKGSKIASELEKMFSDPLNTSPWEYEMAIVDSFNKRQSAGYQFLKNEWAYQDHSEDPHQAAGVLEGGPENYTGKGLRLVGGKDRQRTERMPYHLDHGNFWRQRVEMGEISFCINPDANQDVTMDETDLDLERRQWGSWGRRTYNYLPILESAFRSRKRAENPTDLPYPWLIPHHIYERTPRHVAHGAHFIPEPDPDMVLAATGHFAGYIKPPFAFPRETMKKQNILLTEWDRLEEQYKKTKDESIAERIREIKNYLFNYDEMMKCDSKSFKVAVDVAILNARKFMKEQRDTAALNPDVIDYYLSKVPNPTAIGGGCSHYNGPGKTATICLVGYFPDEKVFRQYTSIEELAEAYHTLMTELRSEGSTHTSSQMVMDEEIRDYLLRKDRRKFPRLIAEYTPLWTHRKFGPEFGDALKPGQKIVESDLTNFGAKLRKRRRGLTAEERDKNFVDDYHFFENEVDYQ